MTGLFLSHSRRDRAAVEQVHGTLRSAGFAGTFLDFDPVDGIPAGRRWERDLYSHLRRCDAVVFLATASSVTSSWCFAELALARSLGKLVIGVRLEPGRSLALLDDVQWVDWGDNTGRHALLEGLRRAGLDPADSFAWDPVREPYPGLGSFGVEDSAVFFGRSRETARLLELLHPTLQHGPSRCVAVVGPSGSGKSSLLRAGLLPRLNRTANRWVVLPPLRPGSDPTRNLARSIASALTARDHPRPSIDDVEARLRAGPNRLRDFALELGAQDGDAPLPVLLVLDQAEELVTRSGPQEQQAFLHLLGWGARGGQPALGHCHGPLRVPQHRAGAGWAGRHDRRRTCHRAARSVAAGRGDRTAGATWWCGLHPRARAMHGRGHRRR